MQVDNTESLSYFVVGFFIGAKFSKFPVFVFRRIFSLSNGIINVFYYLLLSFFKLWCKELFHRQFKIGWKNSIISSQFKIGWKKSIIFRLRVQNWLERINNFPIQSLRCSSPARSLLGINCNLMSLDVTFFFANIF